MQNYKRIYNYMEDYWKLLYDIYPKFGISYLCTYYNINKDETVWDDEFLMAGYYEKFGSLSGMKFDKYLLLPVYFTEETSTEWDAQQEGYINEGQSSITIPWNYGITPYANDQVFFEQTPLITPNDPNINPLFGVTGIEKRAHQEKTFWKLKLNIEQSVTTRNIDIHVANTYVFFDYTKKIYNVPQSQTLTRMLVKNETVRRVLKNRYDENSGFYFL